MKSRIGAIVGIAVLAILSVATAPAALADGGQVPSQAVSVSLGVAYFGNNSDYACNVDTCRIDFWKLPTLLAGDAVTVAWKLSGNNGPEMCLEGGVDDSSWNQNLCNLSTRVSNDTAGKRTVLIAKSAADKAFLTFGDEDCFGPCGYYGPYQFTVESVQHALGLSLGKPAAGSIKGTAYLANGQPAPDGTVVPLVVRMGGKAVTIPASTSSGSLTYKLAVPAGWRHKRASLQLSRPADSTFLAATTPPVTVTLP